MEGQVGLGLQAAAAHAVGEGLVGVEHRRQLLVGMAVGGQPGGVAFERDAHLLAAQVGGDVLRLGQRADARRRLVADEGAEALVRGDQAVGAQPQQRLAHHRARDAEALGDVHLRRQLLADLQAAGGDLLEDLAVQLVGEPPPLAGREQQRLGRLRRRADGRLGGAGGGEALLEVGRAMAGSVAVAERRAQDHRQRDRGDRQSALMALSRMICA